MLLLLNKQFEKVKKLSYVINFTDLTLEILSHSKRHLSNLIVPLVINPVSSFEQGCIPANRYR